MSTGEGYFAEFSAKMRSAGLNDAAIRAFRHSYESLVAGQTGLIPEHEIEPVKDLPRLDDVARALGAMADAPIPTTHAAPENARAASSKLLAQHVVL